MWTRLRNKLRYLLGGGRIDRELAQELDFHRDMLTADQERLGYSRGTALLNARRKMGNTTLMAEHSRDAWMIAWLDALMRDVRYALRSFARNPGFTLVALLTLALGIGANTAIFRLVDSVMLRILPVQRPEELLAIRGSFSYWRFEQLRDRNEVFSGVIGARTLDDVTLTTGDQPLGRASAELVSGNYFALLGVQPILGSPITPDDDRAAGARPVGVISHGLWQRAFAGSRDVLGRTMRMRTGLVGGGTSGFEPDAPNAPRQDTALVTIIGIAPPEFFGDTVGKLVDVWVPITMQPVLMPGRAWLTRRTSSWVNIMGRRRAGITEDQARESLTRLWRQIRADEIGPAITEQQRRNLANARLNVESAEKGFAQIRRQFSQPLLILMTVVTLVLLIACLNVANLLLARATARQQEISMRLSLGASRARLVRQLLTESLLLAGTGGLLGLVLATVGARFLVNMVSGDSQQIALRLSPDWRILGFTMAVSLLSGVTFGLLPALFGTRRELQHVLKDSSRTGGRRRSRAARALVSVQIAVSLVLLVACGLFLRTLYNLKTETLGYDRTGLIMVRVDPVAAGYKGDDISRAMVELMHRLSGLPGVRSSTFSENGLFSGTESGTPIDAEGFTPASDDDRIARFDQAGPGYFTNVGIPLVLGRDFTERDAAGAPRVTIINDTMARFCFPNQNPIGKHIQVKGPSDVALEVVGVARDAQDHDLRNAPLRRFYVSYLQPIDGITTANFEVRAAGNAGSLFGPIRSEIERFDPKLQILSLKTAQMLVDESIMTERLIAKLSTFFGGLAVLLAAIGLYGVMSYTVARRTTEIGVRMALGAPQSAVASMILGEILRLVAIGSVAGVVVALLLARFVESLVFGLKPHDPATVIAATGILLVIGLVAGYLPARRAARIDPIVALCSEERCR
jgi:predicted permease